MATTINSNMIIYNDLAQTAYLERLQDNLDVFNAASNGAITVIDESIEGDFRKRAWKQRKNPVRYVHGTAPRYPDVPI